MNKYLVNDGYSSSREVEADSYATVGDFIDFTVWNAAEQVTETVLRIRAKAVETIDACLQRVVEKILAMGGGCLITADHGNCEREINDDGTPNTAHTTNLVQFIYAGPNADKAVLEDGILADVAPTLLYLLGIPKPKEMTGHSLVMFKK